MTDTRQTIRLNELKPRFDDELSKRQANDTSLTASKLVRWCIRQALADDAGTMTPDQANAYLNELIELRKGIAKIGGNINQIAYYFNIHDHLVESELSKQHSNIQEQLKAVTKHLREVERGLTRRTY